MRAGLCHRRARCRPETSARPAPARRRTPRRAAAPAPPRESRRRKRRRRSGPHEPRGPSSRPRRARTHPASTARQPRARSPPSGRVPPDRGARGPARGRASRADPAAERPRATHRTASCGAVGCAVRGGSRPHRKHGSRVPRVTGATGADTDGDTPGPVARRRRAGRHHDDRTIVCTDRGRDLLTGAPKIGALAALSVSPARSSRTARCPDPRSSPSTRPRPRRSATRARSSSRTSSGCPPGRRSTKRAAC